MDEQPNSPATERVDLSKVSLVDLCDSDRFVELDRSEAYLNATQDAAKAYDWDGQLVSNDGTVHPGWSVPFAQRKPCARFDMPRIIESQYTSLLFGTDRFPEISFPDDEEAEQYAKGLSETARLPMKMIECRELGAAMGVACASFQFDSEGKPVIEVHKAKHVDVLSWKDRASFVTSAVIKAYKYPRRVQNPETGKMEFVDFYFARLWTETDETVWEPIPEALAKSDRWFAAPKRVVQHGLGFCPFYWAQNLPDSEDEIGRSDFHGQFENFDELNRLLSASVRAVKSNADPTLVVKIDPMHREDEIRKGHGAAIFSPQGADYLTLPGDAVKAIEDTRNALRKAILDATGVIDADPDKLSGSAQSAQALRILYAPMLARADMYREQYGEGLIKPLLLGMLRAARILTSIERRIALSDGTIGVIRTVVKVAPRIEPGENGKRGRVIERTPGRSENLVLNWNPYFSPTWVDIKAAAEAVQAANGRKPIISQRTSIASVQTLFGVNDIDEELARIHDEADEALDRSMTALTPDPASLDGKGPFGRPAKGFGSSGAEDETEEPDDEEDPS